MVFAYARFYSSVIANDAARAYIFVELSVADLRVLSPSRISWRLSPNANSASFEVSLVSHQKWKILFIDRYLFKVIIEYIKNLYSAYRKYSCRIHQRDFRVWWSLWNREVFSLIGENIHLPKKEKQRRIDNWSAVSRFAWIFLKNNLH